MEKVPYTLVVGDKEMNGHTVSVRSRKMVMKALYQWLYLFPI